MSRTYLFDLPLAVHALCTEDENGEQVVILNSRLSREDNLKSYEHELMHVSDFLPEKEINILEQDRHKRKKA
jgi:hypothetical protein